MSKQQSVAKRMAFHAAHDAEMRRFCATLDFFDAHSAHMDFVHDHDDEDLDAKKASKIAAFLDEEENALDELVDAHIAFRQACEMRPPAPSSTKVAHRKKNGKGK